MLEPPPSIPPRKGEGGRRTALPARGRKKEGFILFVVRRYILKGELFLFLLL